MSNSERRLLVAVTTADGDDRQWFGGIVKHFVGDVRLFEAESAAGLAKHDFVQKCVREIEAAEPDSYREVVFMGYGAAGFLAAAFASLQRDARTLLLNTPEFPEEFRNEEAQDTLVGVIGRKCESLLDFDLNPDLLTWAFDSSQQPRPPGLTERSSAGPRFIPIRYLGSDPLSDEQTKLVFTYLYWSMNHEDFVWERLNKFVRDRRASQYYCDQVYERLIHRGRTGLANKLATMPQDPMRDWYVSNEMVVKHGGAPRPTIRTDFAEPRQVSGMVRFEKGVRPAPMSDVLLEVPGAICVPHDVADETTTGIVYPNTKPCELSELWFTNNSEARHPVVKPSTRVRQISGHHLFAGHLRVHFGHFLLETLGRLWAVDYVDKKIDSIMFLPYRMQGDKDRFLGGVNEVLSLMEIDVPTRVISSPWQVESLFVPEVGFGWNGRMSGSSAFREFVYRRLRPNIKPRGGSKIYVSRSKLPTGMGVLIGEDLVDRVLSEQGYEIFHPQDHSFEEQLSRYAAADVILGAEGSALHAAPFTCRPGTKVGIIMRRALRHNLVDYVDQFRGFSGVDPVLIDAVEAEWFMSEVHLPDHRGKAELNFVKLIDELKSHGFIDPNAKVSGPDPSEQAERLESLLATSDEPLFRHVR